MNGGSLSKYSTAHRVLERKSQQLMRVFTGVVKRESNNGSVLSEQWKDTLVLIFGFRSHLTNTYILNTKRGISIVHLRPNHVVNILWF